MKLLSYIKMKVRKSINLKNQIVKFLKFFLMVKKNCFGENIFELDKVQIETLIQKNVHSLEKGLSIPESLRKEKFGLVKASLLMDLLNCYKKKYKYENNYFFNMGICILNKYYDYYFRKGIKFQNIQNFLIENKNFSSVNVGVKKISKTIIDNNRKGNFLQFSNSRHSIRFFSEEKINMKNLNEAIEISTNTPSACNRQSWKVYIIENQEKKDILSSCLNGVLGFSSFIQIYLVVTSDLKKFSKNREPFQAYIDGGIYLMNLIYSLHFMNIDTIPLSGALLEKREKTIRKEFVIPKNELLIGFIGCGIVKDEDIIPISNRKKIERVLF